MSQWDGEDAGLVAAAVADRQQVENPHWFLNTLEKWGDGRDAGVA